MVQEVEGFRSELEVHRFAKVRSLHDGNIVIGLERSAENVSADVAKSRKTGAGWIRAVNNHILIVNTPAGGDERVEVDEVVNSVAYVARRQDVARTECGAAAIDELSVLERERTKIRDQEWRTGLERAHTVYGPAIHELTRPTAQPTGKRKVVVVTDYKPVRSIEVGKTLVGCGIQKIANVQKAIQLVSEART